MVIRLLVVLTLMAPTVCSAQMLRRCRPCVRNNVQRTCCYNQCAHTTSSTQIVNVSPISSCTTCATQNVQPASYLTSASSASWTTTSYPMAGSAVQTVGYQSLSQESFNSALALVNQRRQAAGLPVLQLDPTLMTVAQTKSQIRANRRMTGHDGSSRGGAAVEGVGYSMGGGQFSTCYMYSTGYRYAGAAVAYDGSGRAYYTLLLR